jgi:hypothetical protein
LLSLLCHPSLLNHPPIVPFFLLFFIFLVMFDVTVLITRHYFLLLTFSVIDAVLVLLKYFQVPHLPIFLQTSQCHTTTTIPFILTLASDAFAGVIERYYYVISFCKNLRLVLDKLQIYYRLRVLLLELGEPCHVTLVVVYHITT